MLLVNNIGYYSNIIRFVAGLLRTNYPSVELEDILDKIGTYCGKKLINITHEHFDEPPKWDFYHSVFFSFTVVTTVGKFLSILFLIIIICYKGFKQLRLYM